MSESSFDHIQDAVESFIAIQRPTLSECNRFADLISGFATNLPQNVASKISAALASYAHTPKSVILSLCSLPANHCRPLLLSELHVDTALLGGLIDADIEKARIIARNTALDHHTVSKLRSLNDPKIDQSLELRQKPCNVETEALVSEESQPNVAKADAISAIMASLQDKSDMVVHTALSDALGLGMESIAALCSDPTSRNLPTALHYLRFETDEAWQVYDRVTKSFGSNDGVRQAFVSIYNNLDRRETNRVVSGWQMDELVAILRTSRPANEPGAPLKNTRRAS